MTGARSRRVGVGRASVTWLATWALASRVTSPTTVRRWDRAVRCER